MEEVGAVRAALAAALVPAAAERAQAEVALRKYAKAPGCVPALVEAAAGDRDAQVRHLAALQLRRSLPRTYPKLDAGGRVQTRAALLRGVASEPEPAVRRAVADACAAVASLAVPAGEWPELLGELHRLAQAPEAALRETALVLFASLTETIGEALRQHFAALCAVFQAGLGDAAPRVRLAALRAVGALAELVEDGASEAPHVRALLPVVLDAARATLAAGEDEAASRVFELIDTLAESPAPLLGGPGVPALMEFAIGVATAREHDIGLRGQALDVVNTLARHKPKALVKGNLVGPTITALCPMCCEPDSSADEEDRQAAAAEGMAERVPQAHAYACQVIDMLAQCLPAKHVLPPVMAFVGSAFGSADPNQRRAAASVIGVVVEGCAEALRPRTAELLTPLVGALGDQSEEVRGSAAFSLGQVAQHLQPDAARHHGTVLHPLLAALNASTARATHERLLYALDAWLETLEDEAAPYVPAMLQVLGAALASGSADLQELALSATASAAASAGEAFRPHLPELLPRLVACLTNEQPDFVTVRARALECVGMLVAAEGGREALGDECIQNILVVAQAGSASEHSELREYAHGYYMNAAHALKADFTPYLAQVVPAALQSLAMDDGTVLYDSDTDEDSDSDDDDAGDGVGDSKSLRVRTGVLDEKAAATRALGTYAEHCGVAYAPWLEQVLPALEQMSTYFHEDVREQAVTALQSCVVNTVWAARPDPTDSMVQGAVALALGCITTAVEEDDDKEVVAAAMAAAAETIKGVGRAPCEQFLERLSSSCLAVLQRESSCQLDDEDFGDEGSPGEHEEEDEEEMLLGAVAELLPAIADAVGPAFAPAFTPHYAALMKRGTADRPEGERANVSATLVEVLRLLGEPVARACVAEVAPFCLRELSTSGVVDGRRNAAFCAGVLLHEAGDAGAAFRQPVVAAVVPLFADADDGVRDNACGCAARLLALGGFDGAPAVLAALLDNLPLREDMDEAEPVYGLLCSLLETGGDASLAPRTLSVLAAAAASTETPEECKRRIGGCLAGIQAGVGSPLKDVLQAAWTGSLSDEGRAALTAAVNAAS